jgi:transketolase
MRTAFIETLFELAQHDRRIMLVTGDLGFGVVTRFAQELPDQYVNAGVAEQGMTGLATGLALSGRIVFTYSIANFPVMRCLEQIRNDVCYHRANVKVVAVGGGLAYGTVGMTHHATEDLAMMRALPNMTVVAPGDPVEARHATRAVAEWDGPCYLRIGRAGEPVVHAGDIPFRIGEAIRVRDGSDLTLVSTGGMLHSAVRVADRLAAERGLRARVLSLHTLKPLDTAALRAAAAETRAVFTIEEHSALGGLGGAVAEVLLEGDPRPAIFRRVGLPDAFAAVAGDQEYLRSLGGLDEEGIVRQVAAALTGQPTETPAR